jgi:hypothetical protein
MMLVQSRQSLTYKKDYKSPLEEKVAKQLETSGVHFVYEGVKLEYKVPSRKARYTPDFCFNKPIVIETKGWFRTASERHKMILVRDQNPHLDIRLVFQNANKPIYKGSPTTYAKWADENNFKWADKGTVPQEWIKEIL